MDEPTNRAAETPPRTDTPEHVHLTLSLAPRARDTILAIDGEIVTWAERCTLTLSRDHPNDPARLTIVWRDVGRGEPRRVEEYFASLGRVSGVVELMKEQAITADTVPADALTTFMIRLGTEDDPRVSTLRDILTDAERFRALRAYVEGPVESIDLFPRDVQALDGKELDTLADALRTELTQAGDGEPRRPT